MRLLVACEFSGIVRDAFIAVGVDAVSCDLLPSERPGPHLQCDVRDILNGGWDAMIAHPPCTDLAVSGRRYFRLKRADGRQQTSLLFVRSLMKAPIPLTCIENPIGVISSFIRKPDQIIQPWMFGHGETKATCFWLKGLPVLIPTDVVEGREQRIHRMTGWDKDRWKNRSRTYEGVARAMAEQRGHL